MPSQPGDHRVWTYVLPSLVAALVFAPISTFPFDYDDYVIIGELEGFSPWMGGPLDLWNASSGRPEDVRLAINQGHLPWWTSSDFKFSPWRPLTSAVLAAEHMLFGRNPAGYHVVSLLTYLLLVLAVSTLLLQTLPVATATLAATLYALHVTHAGAVGWIASQNLLLASALAVIGVRRHIQWRVEGSRRSRWLSPTFIALGLLAGEGAMPGLVFIIAYEMLIAADGSRARLRALLPTLGVTGVYLVVYKLLDRGVRAGVGYIDPFAEPLDFIRHFLTLLPRQLMLLFGVDIHRLLFACIALLAVGALIAVLMRAIGKSSAEARTVRWIVVASVLSLPFVSGSPGSIGRTLLIPSVGGCVVIAGLLRSGWMVARGRAGAQSRLEWLAFSLAGIAATLLLSLQVSVAGQMYARVAPHRPPASTGTIDFGTAHDIVALATPIDQMHSRWGGFLHWYMTGTRMRRWWVIASAPEAQTGLIRVTRTSARALELTFQGNDALLSNMQRNFERDPMHAGDEIALDGLRVRILGCRSGAPYRIEISLARSLDDPSLAFLAWQGGGFRRVSLPPPGGTALIRDLAMLRP